MKTLEINPDQAKAGKCAREMKEVKAVAEFLKKRAVILANRFRRSKCQCTTCPFDHQEGYHYSVAEDLSGVVWAIDHLLTVIRSEFVAPYEGEFEVIIRPKS